MKGYVIIIIVAACLWTGFTLLRPAQNAGLHLRYNQVGYLPEDTKIAFLFSNQALSGSFRLVHANGRTAYAGRLVAEKRNAWVSFKYVYRIDFSALRQPGDYRLRLRQEVPTPTPVRIGSDLYRGTAEDLLGFMRQQRCGYNPFLDVVCHRHDGRSHYGPMPDSTYLDVSGGWHDAGDQLKYLITSSFATASMLLAYEEKPSAFEDRVNHLGQAIPNGVPDVLDEARWGLDWIHKLHPAPDQLVHQVADDRDHRGWKWPHEDVSDYGWGVNSYRAAYFADGKPQGLGKYKSQATGLANIAGRSAVAMAMAARIWKEKGIEDRAFAEKCLQAARSLYALGKKHEGYQQGNSFGAPYRYNEDTWADDMEWAAAELYATTGEGHFLEDARRYARLIGAHGLLVQDTAAHYQLYPFLNVGHFRLYQVAEGPIREELAGYYREGIEKTLQRGSKNAYQAGVPFIWCSNNVVVALITQILLYETMTGDLQYHDFMTAQRDWLLGCNPWGSSMFMMMPRDGEYPVDVHTSIWKMTGKEVPGGLVDGPLWRTIYDKLLGLELTQPDEFEVFQNAYVVYHDDIGDYSTNEPTMDGTASAVYMMAFFTK
jgi:endoglucanase